MKYFKKLKKRSKLYISVFVVIVSLLSISSATFAWYTQNISVRSTKLKLAAGTSVHLSISNDINGSYASNSLLEDFKGRLNPVSTDKIQNGFQKVLGYTNGTATKSNLVANLFGKGDFSDYYKTSLFFKTDTINLDLAVSGIDYKDASEQSPVSTAIRVGFVDPVTKAEYIFAINQEENPFAEYNTEKGEEGHVLDSTKTDGSTVAFEPYTEEAYGLYDKSTGEVKAQENTIRLMEVGQQPRQLDIYIWLEGCDEDCTGSLSESVLKNLAISFCGMEE